MGDAADDESAGDDPVGAPSPAGDLADLEPEPPSVVEVFGAQVQTARAYARLLATDGVIRGLIGPRETDRLWTRHLLNCAALTDLIPHGARLVDVGSGAGLPGLVLAIARPDVQVILVEPLERRVRFLLEAIDRLELDNCEVVRSRAQDAGPSAGGADLVVSRAVAPLGRLAGWCSGLVRPGGTFLALKGSSAEEELVRDADEVRSAGLIDAAVVRVDGPAGPAFVVRATRTADRPSRPRRANRGRAGGKPVRPTNPRGRSGH